MKAVKRKTSVFEYDSSAMLSLVVSYKWTKVSETFTASIIRAVSAIIFITAAVRI
jgi:hypothetical protein